MYFSLRNGRFKGIRVGNGKIKVKTKDVVYENDSCSRRHHLRQYD